MPAAGVAQRLDGYGGRGAVFVCEADGGVCGFAALEPEQPEAGVQEGGLPPGAVMGVWLQPSARRKGIGRELALMALEFARAAGYAKVRGTLPAGNEAALAFFSEIGALAQVGGGGIQYALPLGRPRPGRRRLAGGAAAGGGCERAGVRGAGPPQGERGVNGEGVDYSAGAS